MHGRHRRGDGQHAAAAEHGARVNQRKHEPLPANHDADSAEPEPAGHAEHAPEQDEPGQAVRDLMGGPQPQGDVPDAPATQIAAGEGEEDQVARIRYVANAVPGKPDGEVDTRS
ncbi:MAG TPA: hypothetical protein VGL63_06680 [Streptosporangiaceae bacterium]|jgi:hypothetical protein